MSNEKHIMDIVDPEQGNRIRAAGDKLLQAAQLREDLTHKIVEMDDDSRYELFDRMDEVESFVDEVAALRKAHPELTDADIHGLVELQAEQSVDTHDASRQFEISNLLFQPGANAEAPGKYLFDND